LEKRGNRMRLLEEKRLERAWKLKKKGGGKVPGRTTLFSKREGVVYVLEIKAGRGMSKKGRNPREATAS